MFFLAFTHVGVKTGDLQHLKATLEKMGTENVQVIITGTSHSRLPSRASCYLTVCTITVGVLRLKIRPLLSHQQLYVLAGYSLGCELWEIRRGITALGWVTTANSKVAATSFYQYLHQDHMILVHVSIFQSLTLQEYN